MSASESQLCLLGQGDAWPQEFMVVGLSVAAAAAGCTQTVDVDRIKRYYVAQHLFKWTCKDRIWLGHISNEVINQLVDNPRGLVPFIAVSRSTKIMGVLQKPLLSSLWAFMGETK